MTTSTRSERGAPATNDTDTGAPAGRSSRRRSIVTAAFVGGAVAVSLGVYGRAHDPTGEAISTFGFPSLLEAKAWIATAVLVLVGVQVVTASWMWGRLPRAGVAPAWLAPVHRWSGTLAFVLTLPVAYHCLWALGIRTTTPRVAAHSALGCFFYGAFATKLLLLRSPRRPPWMLPVAGGVLTTALVGIWLTSSLWFFTTVGSSGL